jgi:hypothetical protein
MAKWSGKTSNVIEEIELNVSNVCTAECVICSRPHGCGNSPFMEEPVFEEMIKQLHDVKFKLVQTSGNGEAFLNPHYLDYVETLKTEFPHAPRWTYNNFSLLDKERANRIILDKLFDKVHVRIDSLHKWIFERNSNLNQDRVFENLEYFLSVNTRIPVVILYNDIKKYYKKCISWLGKRPSRDFFTDEELQQVPDEADQIKKHFQQFTNVPLTVCTIGHSLWGERMRAPKDTTTPCPKFNVISKVTWVCPNADVSVCCYDDNQRDFVAGNIMEDHILDIFYGEKRKETLRKIKNREITDYPCTNPKCCSMGGETFGIEEK